MQRMEKNSHIDKVYFINYFLPLTLIVWMGSSVKYLNFFLTDNIRWLSFVIMLTFMSLKPILFRFLDKKFALILLLYCAWCFSTIVWSIIPILSFMKSALYFLLIPTLILLGIEWVRRNSDEKIFNYLWLFALITLMSAFLGKKSLDIHEYYSGLTSNANMLGFMVAASSPYFFWKVYKTFKKKSFYLYLFLLGCCFYFSFLCMSRTAMIVILMVAFGMLFSLNLSKKVSLLITMIFLIIGIMAYNPIIIDGAIGGAERFVMKGQTNLIYSRSRPWEESYHGAQEGGWFGLGFGIAYGNYDFSMGNKLSTRNYGREKGNSQMAIVEEIGLIGFLLYITVIAYIFLRLIILYLTRGNQDQRVIVGILTGLYVGMLSSSIFEAWWLSPGAPEIIYFWILVGIIRGFEISVISK